MNMINSTPFGRAHTLALISEIAYLQPEEAKKQAEKLGFPQCKYYDRDGAQAYKFENDTDVIFTCRGTEPGNLNDMLADLKALQVKSDTVGKVHLGFKTETDDIWPMVYDDLKSLNDSKKNLWFTGHSLGGAMVTIKIGRAHV